MSKTNEDILEKFKGNFRQYLIYVEKEVYCVDPDYDCEGMYACDDDATIFKSPFDLYDNYIENFYDDDSDEAKTAKEYFEGFSELDEYDAWDKIEEYFKIHFDYVTFGHYRLEYELKNICFTKDTAIELCNKYSNKAYYTTDRIKNDDILDLINFFNKDVES